MNLSTEAAMLLSAMIGAATSAATLLIAETAKIITRILPQASLTSPY